MVTSWHHDAVSLSSSSPYKVTSTSPMPFICVSDILFLLRVSVPRLQSVKHGLCRANCIICFIFLVRRRKIRLDNPSDVLRDCSMNVLVATSQCLSRLCVQNNLQNKLQFAWSVRVLQMSAVVEVLWIEMC